LLGLLFHPEAGGSIFLRNLSEFLPDYTALHPEKQYSSNTVLTVTKQIWNGQEREEECGKQDINNQTQQTPVL
jgi:hypothetical protein